ncbi:hypothetical protein PPERSA_04980 [Pseudocohnilembus persalinus]|uniref:Uncharacterized protein n=1 Tax=Pseudocohnilembus persalinus TaxID=266149 RepID=A0A0V0QVL9_PSEPJ|nr:hypothetical protein PPERSA_04980 [Pseudocohnilembus persalinus]|eukprot:KRX06367.1 hypothetical protein PPERSA_04980 [Pseudocohnilembus persalinus]
MKKFLGVLLLIGTIATLFLVFSQEQGASSVLAAKKHNWMDRGCPETDEYEQMCKEAEQGEYCGPNSWGNFECCKSGVECKEKSSWWTDDYKACAGWNGQYKLGKCPETD